MEHYYLAPIILSCANYIVEHCYLAPIILWSIIILHQLYYGTLLSCTNYAYQELFLVLGLDNAAVVVLFGCR